MILHFNYEELRALRSGARAALGDEPGSPSPVLAPSQERARLEALRLTLDEGEVSLSTLGEVRDVLAGVEAVVWFFHAEMDQAVLATHPASEPAVTAYFDYAHALGVARRLREMADEMTALIELVTGRGPDDDTARSFHFPD